MLSGRGLEEVLLVIPARYASSRFPGKPLADLCGMPLIGRVLERIRGLEGVTPVVATDDPRIADAVERLGAAVELTSSQCRTGSDRVAELAARRDAPLVVNVQGDEPFLERSAIERLIAALRDDPGVGMATLACPLHDPARWHDPGVVKVVVDARGDALYFSRSPIPWPRDSIGVPPGALQHLGVYGYRRRTLLELARTPPAPLELIEQLEQLRALTAGVRIRVLPAEGHWLGVDTPEDLEAARAHFTSMRGATP